MPFQYPALLATQRNIDEAGTNLLTADYTLAGVLGAYFEITFKVNAIGLDAAGDPQTVYNKLFSFRYRLFTQPNSAYAPSPQGFKLKTGNAVAGALPMQFQTSSAQNATNTNFSATLEVVSATQVKIVWRLYVTSEEEGYTPIFIQTLNRLLSSQNTGGYMELETGGQYELGATGISIVTLVSDFPTTIPPAPAYEILKRQNSSASEYYTPINLKWPGRSLGNAGFEWILSEFMNTTAGGNMIANKLHRATGQPHQAKYDDNFIVSSSSLSAIEDNYLSFKFAKADGASTSMSAARAFVLRVDSLSGYQQFLTDYEASIGNLPLSDLTGYGQVSGAIHSPSGVVSSGGTQCIVSFRIPPSHLISGARYRILIVLYSTGTQDVYSGVSHELTVNDHPPIFPFVDLYTADYFQESVLPRSLMSYHSAFRCRIEIYKASVDKAFEYYGLSGSFDANVSYVRAQVMKPGTESAAVFTPDIGPDRFAWTRGAGLVRGQDYVNTFEYIYGAFVAFVDEEWLIKNNGVGATYYISVRWEIGIESTLPNGENVILKCQYDQRVNARRWESEAGQPGTPAFDLTMQLYRIDGVTPIPAGSQFVCGAAEILALVTKSNDLAGGGLDAYLIPETYAETATNGTTADANIKQRRGGFLGYFPAAQNPAINAYDALFSNNAVMGTTIDDAGIRVDIQSLSPSQKHWLVGIARKDWPNGIPFIGEDVTVEMVRSSDVTTITADFTDWWLAFAAVCGSVSPYNFRIVNLVTQNFAGITDGAFNNPSTDDTQIEVTVDHEAFPQLLNIEVIYEIEGVTDVSGSDHTIRFMVRRYFELPAADGSTSGTISPGDWKAVDFDF